MIIFFHQLKHMFLGAQKNSLIETFLSTHNIVLVEK